MEERSKAASEEVVAEEELSPIDDDQFLQGLSKAASNEVEVVGRIIEGPSKEASGEALHHEIEKAARLRLFQFPECISKYEFRKSPSRQRQLIIRDESYKPRIGLWNMLSSDETPGKIMKNISPIIDEIMVNQFIKGLRKEYATDEDVDFDMIIEVLGDILRETMQVLRNKYPSRWLTISLTSISLRSISRLKGLQKIVWDEFFGKIMEEQLIGWVFVVWKKVHKNIHRKIVKRLRDENMIGSSKEESEDVVHKIIEELRPSLDNIMKGSPLKEAFSLAIEWIRKELEPIVRLPSKEVSDKLISIVRGIISEIDGKIAVGSLGVSNELTAILGKLAEQTKKVTKELIVHLAHLDMNLEGMPRKVIDCRRDIEMCVVLLVPDCGDKRKCIEEMKRKLELKEEEQEIKEEELEIKEKQKSKEELVYDAIRKIENSSKESNDKCDQIIKSINVRDNKSCETVKYADRGDKKASKKDRRKKMKSVRKKGLDGVHFGSASTSTLEAGLPITLEAPQARNVDPISEASLDGIHFGSTSTSTLEASLPITLEAHQAPNVDPISKASMSLLDHGRDVVPHASTLSRLASILPVLDDSLETPLEVAVSHQSSMTMGIVPPPLIPEITSSTEVSVDIFATPTIAENDIFHEALPRVFQPSPRLMSSSADLIEESPSTTPSTNGGPFLEDMSFLAHIKAKSAAKNFSETYASLVLQKKKYAIEGFRVFLANLTSLPNEKRWNEALVAKHVIKDLKSTGVDVSKLSNLLLNLLDQSLEYHKALSKSSKYCITQKLQRAKIEWEENDTRTLDEVQKLKHELEIWEEKINLAALNLESFLHKKEELRRQLWEIEVNEKQWRHDQEMSMLEKVKLSQALDKVLEGRQAIQEQWTKVRTELEPLLEDEEAAINYQQMQFAESCQAMEHSMTQLKDMFEGIVSKLEQED